ncbi:MAG TPA: hypothetical protein VN327_11085 [Pseudonocardiaceae bacterium]|jgi:hypothetical protein|nr:hypothetical protein [Pseudonocardiaceae bacterium]
MAVAPTLPQIEQPVPLVSGDTPADKPVTKQRWITAKALLAFIIAIVANLAIIGVIVNHHDPASTATAHPRVQTVPAPPAPPAFPPGLATTLGEGRFVVGTDIAPGTYRTTGPSGHLDCYWERLKHTGGSTDSIIANNLGRGPATVTIDNSDGAFQTRWCNTWTKVS